MLDHLIEKGIYEFSLGVAPIIEYKVHEMIDEGMDPKEAISLGLLIMVESVKQEALDS